MNKKIFFISIITISFWFLIDFIFGEKILKLTQAEWWRVPSNHNYSQLASSIEINDIWGTKRYILCTDKSGFKTSCKKESRCFS